MKRGRVSWVSDLGDESGGEVLSGKVARGFRFVYPAQGIRLAVQIGGTIILARLIGPEAFGLVAMVLVVSGFLEVFRDAGLAQATVQRRQLAPEQVSTLFWVNSGVCLLLAAGLAGLAPLVAWIYGEPRLTTLTLAMAVPLAVEGLCLQHRALLQRSMQFGRIALAESVAAIGGLLVAVVAAKAGAGYWSLVLQRIVVAVIQVALIWILSGWIPGRFRRNLGVRPMLSFGLRLSGFNLLNFFSRNADKFLIGRFVGADALGQYSRAYSLMLLPISQINAPLASVLTPALARLQSDPEAFARVFLRTFRVLAWVTVPAIGVAAASGAHLLAFLLGPGWELAGSAFQMLAVASLFQPLTNICGVVLIATGRTDQLLRWGKVSSVVLVGAFLVGLPWGVIGVATAYAVAIHCLLPYFLRLVFSDQWLTPRAVARAAAGPAALAACLAFALLALLP